MVNELVVLRNDFWLLLLNGHLHRLVDVVRVNDHRRSVSWNRGRLHNRQLFLPVLAILLYWTDQRCLIGAFTRNLIWFLWLCWVDELMGGLKCGIQ